MGENLHVPDCAVCRKRVDRFSVASDGPSVSFSSECHGDMEVAMVKKCDLEEMDLIRTRRAFSATRRV